MRFDRLVVTATFVLLCALVQAAAPRASTQFRIFGGRDGRRVTIRAADGATLSGVYYEPSRRPAPGIVLLHMLRRSHTDWDAAASQLSDAGFAVFALDFRGGDDVGALAIDVRAAKSFLRERPEVNPTSLGIAGAFDRRQSGAARCGRRSRRAVDRAVIARPRLQRAADRSGDEEIWRPLCASDGQHERSVRGALDPAADHDWAGHARGAPDRCRCARNRPAVARFQT